MEGNECAQEALANEVQIARRRTLTLRLYELSMPVVFAIAAVVLFLGLGVTRLSDRDVKRER